MARRNISSGSPLEQPIGFSRAVRIGQHVAVSGTAPLLPDGTNAAVGDLYGQTHRCLEIMQAAIEEAGATLQDVIRTRLFLKDISQWEEAGRAHAAFFRGIQPASSFIEVSGFIRPEWLVETEAECVVQGTDPTATPR